MFNWFGRKSAPDATVCVYAPPSSVDGSWHFGAQGLEICGLELRGGYTNAESGDFHGIHAKARFSLHDVVISSFEGDGLHISATSLAGDAAEGNANLFRVQNAAMLGCRNGAYIRGADANAAALPLGASLRFNNRNHVAWGYANSDQYDLEAFEITTPGTLASMDPHYMWFPRGFYFGDGGNAKKMLSGTAAPTTGAWNRGDMAWNSAPSAGGVPGWMCTSGGSPGTWTAMASLAA